MLSFLLLASQESPSYHFIQFFFEVYDPATQVPLQSFEANGVLFTEGTLGVKVLQNRNMVCVQPFIH